MIVGIAIATNPHRHAAAAADQRDQSADRQRRDESTDATDDAVDRVHARTRRDRIRVGEHRSLHDLRVGTTDTRQRARDEVRQRVRHGARREHQRAPRKRRDPDDRRATPHVGETPEHEAAGDHEQRSADGRDRDHSVARVQRLLDVGREHARRRRCRAGRRRSASDSTDEQRQPADLHALAQRHCGVADAGQLLVGAGRATSTASACAASRAASSSSTACVSAAAEPSAGTTVIVARD